MRKIFRVIAWLLFLLVLGGALLCWQISTHLVRAQAPEKADAIVLLGGDADERAPFAAQLYHQGYAPKVVVTGSPFDRDDNGSFLLKNGVPARDIIYEDKSTSTKTNAINTEEVLKKQGFKRILLVTSWYHSARSYRTFHKYLGDETIISVPTPQPEKWGRTDYIHVRSELVKSLGYTVVHGVPLW